MPSILADTIHWMHIFFYELREILLSIVRDQNLTRLGTGVSTQRGSIWLVVSLQICVNCSPIVN